MRWLGLLLLGMALGALATVSAIGAMRQGTPLHKGAMAVTSHQFRDLRGQVEAGRCDAEVAGRRLRLMRDLGADFDAAFLPNGRDELFRRHRKRYTAALDAALQSPPTTCAALQAAVRPIGQACRACHDDFR
jgi:hypothetical protein